MRQLLDRFCKEIQTCTHMDTVQGHNP